MPLPCRRACAPGFALRARASATPAVLRAPDSAGDRAVPSPENQDIVGPWEPAHSPVPQSGVRVKTLMWAGAGVEECQCPCGATRRIGATNRGAACVALRPPLSGDICRPPRPGECPHECFSRAPRGHQPSTPRCQQAARPPIDNPPRANYPIAVLTACNQSGFGGVACPLG
jgi:hypothetical protein